MAENVITLKGNIIDGQKSLDKDFYRFTVSTIGELPIGGRITYKSGKDSSLNTKRVIFCNGVYGFPASFGEFALTFDSADEITALKIEVPKSCRLEFMDDSIVQAINLKSVEFENVTLRTGFIANNFSKLTNLESVDLCPGIDSSVDLGSFEKLTSLKELCLKDGIFHIYGRLSSISKLFNLNHLCIESENVYGNLSDLSGLVNLKYLSIKSCPILGDVKSLTELEKLTDIILTQLEIVGDVNFIEHFKHLQRVTIDKCGLTGILFLRAVTASKNLFIVHLTNMSIGGAIDNFAKVGGLLFLDVNNTLFDGDVSSLKDNKKLKKLCVFNTKVFGDASSLNDSESLKSFKYKFSDVTSTWNRAKIGFDLKSILLTLNSCHNRSYDVNTECANFVREVNSGLYDVEFASDDVIAQNAYTEYTDALQAYKNKLVESREAYETLVNKIFKFNIIR